MVNFRKGEMRNFFYNFKFLNCISHFKSIIKENYQNYTSLKGLFANCSKLQPKNSKNSTTEIAENDQNFPKLSAIEIRRNFAKRSTETYRNVSRNRTPGNWDINIFEHLWFVWTKLIFMGKYILLIFCFIWQNGHECMKVP